MPLMTLMELVQQAADIAVEHGWYADVQARIVATVVNEPVDDDVYFAVALFQYEGHATLMLRPEEE